jgi:predicted ATP-dependent endonuclease of OLD family
MFRKKRNVMQNENTQKEMRQYYQNTITSVEKILADLKERNEKNDEELQDKVSSLISKVEGNNEKFKKLVEDLEKDSEFDKFTIAFLGQTNAGKSTIIEALRILFDEESRKTKAAENQKGNITALTDYNKQYSELIHQLENLKSKYKTPASSIIIPIVALLIGIAIGIGIGGLI